MTIGFFNPVSWGWDKISGYVTEEAAELITSVLGWLVTWVLSGVAWIMEFVGEVAGSEALQPLDLRAGWFAQGAYKAMQELGVYGAAVALIVGLIGAMIGGQAQLMFKRVLLQGMKWGFFSALFLEGVGLYHQAVSAAETAVVQSGLGSNAENLFGSFGEIADAASASGALAGIMAIFVGILLIAGGVVMIALKVIISTIFVVMALFAPIVAPALFGSRKDMLARYVLRLAAVGLGPFMMSATLVVGSSLVMATIGGEGFSVSVPPPPTEMSEPVDVFTELKKRAEAGEAEGAAAGVLVTAMISALGIMLVTTVAPVAPSMLIEYTSDSVLGAAGGMAVAAPAVAVVGGAKVLAARSAGGGGAAGAAGASRARGALGHSDAGGSGSTAGAAPPPPPASSEPRDPPPSPGPAGTGSGGDARR